MADSAFVTGPNLTAADKIHLRFISRLPENYVVARTVKQRAWERAWTDIGSIATRREAVSYQASEQQAEIDGRPYRLVVLRSSQLEKRKAATFEKELTKQLDDLEQRGSALARQAFSCQEDAEAAASSWRMQAGYHRLTANVAAQQVKIKRGHSGRPRKDEPVLTRTVYRVTPQVVSTAARFA